MNELDLLEKTENYYYDKMNEEERASFENLRKTNHDAENIISEYLILLSELEHHEKVKRFKQIVNRTENLSGVGEPESIEKENIKTSIRDLWNRYRQTAAVAAAVAVIVSTLTIGVTFWSKNKKTDNLTPLVDNKLNQMQYQLRQMEYKLNDVAEKSPKFEANFRATGFLADGRGYIITNAHVVDEANNLIIENLKGEQYTAIPLYSNPQTDLAILKITDTSYKKISTLPYSFKKEKSDLAEEIFTLGYPREEVVYSEGYISSKSGYFGDTSAYQINISVNPGNSGGPVFNKQGEIIGIISSKETDADGVVFATKSGNVFDAIKEVERLADEKIHLTSNNTLIKKNRINQIRTIEDFVFKVKGN